MSFASAAIGMPGSGISPASISKFTKKYSKKWPHCLNIQCIHGDRSTFELKCLEHSDCTGFSFPAGATGAGGGCLKKCGPEEFGGWGTVSHDYWYRGSSDKQKLERAESKVVKVKKQLKKADNAGNSAAVKKLTAKLKKFETGLKSTEKKDLARETKIAKKGASLAVKALQEDLAFRKKEVKKQKATVKKVLLKAMASGDKAQEKKAFKLNAKLKRDEKKLKKATKEVAKAKAEAKKVTKQYKKSFAKLVKTEEKRAKKPRVVSVVTLFRDARISERKSRKGDACFLRCSLA